MDDIRKQIEEAKKNNTVEENLKVLHDWRRKQLRDALTKAGKDTRFLDE